MPPALHSPPLAPTRQGSSTLSDSTPPRSVLVVEDDADIRDTLSGLLSGEGYDVRTCANGLEALERLRHGDHPDLIVLDLMMPVMDGWQFRVHQKKDPHLASIPVLAISADGTPKAAAIDADVYLRKPVDCDTLLAAIERMLSELERRRLHTLQAETERLASLGTLAAGVAHEINNPLAYVTANLSYVAQHLASTEPSEQGQLRAALAEARDGCERIRAIVRDLQLLSRDTREDEGATVDVRRVLDSSANIVAAEVRVRARLVKQYGEVPRVAANASRLGQILLNLILNAAQAIPEGDPSKHEVRLITSTGSKGDAVIEVEDTGEGIRPEVRARIFDPFFTTKPVGVGTGLGLSIAHRLVTAMSGELTVDSAPGRGATFRVRLPPAYPAAPARETQGQVKVKAPRARVLVIDDEDLIVVMLGRILGAHHDVTTTTKPDEGIERIRRGERFDVILCDLMMPDKTGMDVHAAVDALEPDQARRMLFLTGGAFSPRAREFLEGAGRAQGDGAEPLPVIEKPFATDDLLARIASMLAKRGPAA
jgi:signal transduction histidine kinase